MDFIDAMHTYFRGEKQIGLFLIPMGLAFAGFALSLYRTQTGAFMWGMVIPLAVVGLAATLGGAGLAVRTDRQVETLERQHREAPRTLIEEEVPRMARVNRNWPYLKATWAALILASLVALFFAGREWTTGLSLALLLVCTTVMLIDAFAERRARIYSDQLDALARSLPPP